MSTITLVSFLAISLANPVPQAAIPQAASNPTDQAADQAATNDLAVINAVRSDVLQFIQTSNPVDQADVDRQDDFFGKQAQRLETTVAFQQQSQNSHSSACAPLGTNPLPSFLSCNSAVDDFVKETGWPPGTVFGQKDPATGACASGVVACMPRVWAEGDCQLTLDFYPDVEKTETTGWVAINDWITWETLKCQAWR